MSRRRSKRPARRRRTSVECDQLRAEAFDLRQRGFSLREIADRLGVSHQLVQHHLSRFYADALVEFSAKTSRDLLAEAITRALHDRDFAARSREAATDGRERLAWTWAVMKAGRRLDALLLESGLPMRLPAAELPAVRRYFDLMQTIAPEGQHGTVGADPGAAGRGGGDAADGADGAPTPAGSGTPGDRLGGRAAHG